MRAISFTAVVVSAQLLASCRSDNPLDAPSLQADAQCNDDPLLCGPVDGTIHDGTGDGSVTQVAGDPSPGAPGIWLGWYGSGQYCYANYNSFMNDGDHDWLDDQCEYLIAKAFAPALAISPSDGYDKGEPYWAVKYFPNDPNYGWGEFVRIAYMPAYYLDGGTPGSGATAHVGDSEFIMVGVQYNPSTQHWEVRDAYLSAHAGKPTVSSEYVRLRDNLEYPTRYLAYPRVWVSRGKHANYKSRSDCNSGAFGFDSCSDNVTVGRLRVYRGRNAGSLFLDRFPNGVASANPLYSNNYRLEYFYTQQEFKGWQVTSESGGSPYTDMLISNVFECFDYTYVFQGTCYWGPGPNPPSWTKLTAWIDGPTQVTAYQTYTWSTFATGGTLPYYAEWWRQYSNESGPTLVGTSTNNGGAYTAGSWTGTVDRCQNLTVTVKVWSNDGQYWQRSASVSTTCPPPPVTVYIDGPGMISTKGTYTFTAVTSGTSGPTFTWKERFCDYMDGTSCSAWQTITGLGSTFQRTLNKDCSTTEKNFQLHVDVLNSDGRTAEADHTAALCEYF